MFQVTIIHGFTVLIYRVVEIRHDGKMCACCFVGRTVTKFGEPFPWFYLFVPAIRA